MKNKRYDMSFYFNPTDPDEIHKIITFLKGKKSSGHDGITTSFIKQIKEHNSLPISIIVNKSIATGKVPDVLKLAKVIPIYKSKEVDQCTKYRPISLLPSISKILEKVVHKRIYHFMNMQNIFYPSQ